MKLTLPNRAFSTALLLAFLLTTYLARADEPTGVRFFKGTWKELLAEAKKQNKPIFVDVYTTWCGPCKQMAKEAFSNKAVGELLNANFVNYQLDAEKGEGVNVAKQYTVTGYPTSLYLTAAGSVLSRNEGYGNVTYFIRDANKALEAAKDPKPIALWDKQFATGKRNAAFLSEYLGKRARM